MSLIAQLPAMLQSPFTWMVAAVAVVAFQVHGLRAFANCSTWLAIGLFFGLFLASNAWRAVPMPDPSGVYETDFEALRIWVAEATAMRHWALLMTTAAFGWVCLVVLVERPEPRTFTGLWLFIDALLQSLEVIEFRLCKLNSEWLGHEHRAIIEGLDRGACTREFGWLGSFIFPAIALVPLVFILDATLERAGKRVWGVSFVLRMIRDLLLAPLWRLVWRR